MFWCGLGRSAKAGGHQSHGHASDQGLLHLYSFKISNSGAVETISQKIAHCIGKW
jgi:hypothetical protein